jgi:hypothetical protein
VVSTTAGKERACAEGPVFDAERLEWELAEIPPGH